MKGAAFQIIVGTSAIFALILIFYLVGPVYMDNIAPTMINISNEYNRTEVSDNINFGQNIFIAMFFILIIGIIIWMVLSTQRTEYDSGEQPW